MGLDNEREEQAIRRVTDRLVATFVDTHTSTEVEATVTSVRRHFDGHAVRDFVPILVERMARRQLAAPDQPLEQAESEPWQSEPWQSEPAEPEPTETEPTETEPTETERAETESGESEPWQSERSEIEPLESEPLAPEPRAPEHSEVEPAGVVVPQPDRDGSATVLDSLRSRFSTKWVLAAGAAAVVVIVGVVLELTVGGSPKSAAPSTAAPPPPLTVVHGVVGSEKMPFFADPLVVAEFAHDGLRVEADGAGSREIATSVDLTKYDFAFPSSEQAAERIMLRRPGSTTKYTPFSSPMAIATFKPIVDLLTKAGVVKPGPIPTFDMSAYLYLVGNGTRWDQLDGNTAYPVDKNILVSTTDPRSSNSAAMYLAIASYVANSDTIVAGSDAVQNVLPTVSPLFVGQGYTESSSEGPFQQYLTDDMGSTPMVWIYEAQFVDATVHGLIKPDMVLMYPSPTVMSKHTLVPLDPTGDKVGRLLVEDPTLQRLAAEHGFRTGDPSQFAEVVTDHNVPAATNLLDVVETPTYDILEQLLDGVAKAYN